MQPCGMTRCLAGLTPLFEHIGRDSMELRHLSLSACIDRAIEAVAIGIPEVDRLKNAMIGWPQDLDALGLDLSS